MNACEMVARCERHQVGDPSTIYIAQGSERVPDSPAEFSSPSDTGIDGAKRLRTFQSVDDEVRALGDEAGG